MSRQPRKRAGRKPADLPQVPETWGVGVALLRTWIAPKDGPPHRPTLVLVLDLETEGIFASELFEPVPSAEDVLGILHKAMAKPPRVFGGPRRPRRVITPGAALAEAMAPALAEIGVTCEAGDLPMLPEIVAELEGSLRQGEPEHPGLLSVKGVTPELAGGVFAAAAEFYRAEPWVQLDNLQALAIRFPARGGKEHVASVMGNGGVEYGLAVYRNWKMFERTATAFDSPEEALDPQGSLSVFFGDITQEPFDDLEAMERYGWDVAGEEAYPVPVVFLPDEDEPVRRPSAVQLRWIEAALRATAVAVRDHLRPDGKGDYLPVEVTFDVPTHAGRKPVAVRYPAGQLRQEARPVGTWQDIIDSGEDDDALPVIDRRMMEGFMASLAAGIGDEAAGLDPRLEEAQELMYEAWEESNPAKRLSLTRKALRLSPDCADAYVLLAEEEAPNLGKALEYYRQGVEAGERALGPAYFEENKGHFWGLLETRPYMRAREGLANTLWSLDRYDEAIGHYRALLELNPNDNQGIRHVLLNLLMTLDRDADALALLKKYKGEGMAEWLFTWALVEFRQGGAGKAADRRLKSALKENPHVPAYLTGRKRIPGRLPPYYGFGDDAEAVHYAHRYLPIWRRTPGAVEWLKGKVSKVVNPAGS